MIELRLQGQASNFGKYLGLPAFVGRNKRNAFSYIEDKIRQRIGSWNKKLLSKVGKEVLLKSVAQAMPTFSMGVFLLPDSVCLSIERTMNKFWWGSGSERGIHWKAWDRLCVPKKFGGLGFKDLHAFNLAMLEYIRQGTTRNPLFFSATVGNCPSYCWRSIMAAHDLVCQGVRKRIGDGKSTLIWSHPWLPDDLNPMINTPMPPQLNGSLVVGLIDEGSSSWDYSILTDIFAPDDVTRIMRVPISSDYEDSWYWFGDSKGCYSVKGGYRCIVGNFEGSPNCFVDWTSLWKIKVPPKWKTFLWRALNDILPVTTNLLLKRVEVNLECPMCGLSHEDTMHALILWDFSQLVWHESQLPFSSILGDSFNLWCANMISSLIDENICMTVAILYRIWRARNNAVWDGFLPTPRRLVATVAATLHAWTAVNAPQHQTVQVASPVGGVQHVHHPATLRCYVDASFHHNTLKASFRAVLVTTHGGFVAACGGPLPDSFSPLMAEAAACKEALAWLRNRGIDSIQLCLDCSQLHSALQRPESSHSYAGLFIDACKTSLSSFLNCHISLISRSLNSLAHTLAVTAGSFLNCHISLISRSLNSLAHTLAVTAGSFLNCHISLISRSLNSLAHTLAVTAGSFLNCHISLISRSLNSLANTLAVTAGVRTFVLCYTLAITSLSSRCATNSSTNISP
ncbi:uncharacterized protein LOC116015828 [Ipomoea triloba]|uniref:uncharacterized protein LOC116015828 n=1 Tax=Ipomoea triloba TaxID=35885 RepID=UPI00125D5E87|nr:uncharacterized protein LOC116015828 [Ipomoea triloba]